MCGSGQGHIVHYPVRAGAAVNIVAVAADATQTETWSTAASRDEVLARFPSNTWADAPRALLAAAEQWQKWTLCERAPSPLWGRGPVTLLGDAATRCCRFLPKAPLWRSKTPPCSQVYGTPTIRRGTAPLRAGAPAARSARSAAARRNDLRYHLPFPASFVRDTVLHALGGERLLAQYDWLYPVASRRRDCGIAKVDHVPTTIAGSLPKPEWLAEPNNLWPAWRPPALSSRQPSATPRCWRSSCRRTPASTSSPMASSRASISCTAFWTFVEGIDFDRKVRDGHPRRPLQGDGADRHRADARCAAACMRPRLGWRAPTPRDKLKFTLPGPMTIVDTIADAHYGDKRRAGDGVRRGC